MEIGSPFFREEELVSVAHRLLLTEQEDLWIGKYRQRLYLAVRDGIPQKNDIRNADTGWIYAMRILGCCGQGVGQISNM